MVNRHLNDLLEVFSNSQDVKDILKSTKDEIVHANMMVLIEGDEYGTIK